jgi:DNA-binding transcriptional LysR family regulator
MELAQIRHFIAVAETGSFTKGARRAAVSQPAISASIARLEAELDVKLLDRRRSPILPTPAGMRLLEAGKSILYACSKVKAELKTVGGPRPFRIGILHSLSSRHVAKVLGLLRCGARFAAVQVFDGTSEQLVSWLARDEVDVVLTIFDEQAAKFPGKVLFKEPYVVAVPEGHRFLHRQNLKLDDLQDEPCIIQTRCDQSPAITETFASRGISLRIVYETDQDDRALALVAAGMGVAILPAQQEPAEVKQVPLTDLDRARSIGLLWSPERTRVDIEPFITLATGDKEWIARGAAPIGPEWIRCGADSAALPVLVNSPQA